MKHSKDLADGLNRLREGLTAYCARLLWSSGDLEDALQEILLTALKKHHEFEPGTDFRAWIYRIATLTCFGFNRRRKRERPAESAPEPAVTLEEELEREYTYEEILRDPTGILENFEDHVRRACLELNDNERAILLLKTVGGLTCAEIARTMDVPLGTAQGLLTRARMKVREKLSTWARAKLQNPPGVDT